MWFVALEQGTRGHVQDFFNCFFSCFFNLFVCGVFCGLFIYLFIVFSSSAWMEATYFTTLELHQWGRIYSAFANT